MTYSGRRRPAGARAGRRIARVPPRHVGEECLPSTSSAGPARARNRAAPTRKRCRDPSGRQAPIANPDPDDEHGAEHDRRRGDHRQEGAPAVHGFPSKPSASHAGPPGASISSTSTPWQSVGGGTRPAPPRHGGGGVDQLHAVDLEPEQRLGQVRDLDSRHDGTPRPSTRGSVPRRSCRRSAGRARPWTRRPQEGDPDTIARDVHHRLELEAQLVPVETRAPPRSTGPRSRRDAPARAAGHCEAPGAATRTSDPVRPRPGRAT